MHAKNELQHYKNKILLRYLALTCVSTAWVSRIIISCMRTCAFTCLQCSRIQTYKTCTKWISPQMDCNHQQTAWYSWQSGHVQCMLKQSTLTSKRQIFDISAGVNTVSFILSTSCVINVFFLELFCCCFFLFVCVLGRYHLRQLHTYIHTYVRTYVRKYVHTYIGTYIHT